MKIAVYRGILFAVTSFVLVTCVSTPKTKFAIEDLAGTTWFNEEYAPSSGSDKATITADGMMKFYSSMIAAEPPWIEKYTITESWYDNKGDLWFKNIWEEMDTGDKFYVLSRISKSGTVWEGCWRGSDYPTELSPIEGTYFIYFRQ